ncbi:Transcription initiation factor TFIID subunit 13 [Chlorella sorokiniana]|uniref:Transcription initiation factor TFIID subunit 13 n=1 Tax=Chlorella sorokiniana TaxID=3076 RepID=A0A2P6TVF3_CHLSO|nr:Transcription initiation factor TFIID subunit 13 [Chlorella sorokiniana]|eukprot:PRW58041.1 Transcription initiation factor TFIID subunit 13 [Chlorella sorokiniana]
MGATPARPARKGSPLPKLLQAVLIFSVAGVLALWTAHIAQSGMAGDSGPPRLLLQGALELAQATHQPDAVLQALPDGDAGLELQQPDEEPPQDLQAGEGVQAPPGQQEQVGGTADQQPDGEWELPLKPEQQDAPQQPSQQQGDTDGDDNGDGDDWSADSSSSTSSSASSSSASGGLAGSVSAAGDGADGPEEVTLDDASDLATFDDPGTRCVVTPSHGKVALLFLAPETELPHDMTWTAWMREARGLLPRGSLAGPEAFCLQQCDASGDCVRRCGAEAACNPLCVAAVQEELSPKRSTAVLQQQHLFSVYVHARPAYKDYPEGSVFQGRLIPDRAGMRAGTHSMMVAIKKLVEAAVLDQRNERFVLVGNTTVPLYHPAMFYQQLMSESKSRVDACLHDEQLLDRQRSTPAMATDRFNPDKHWRKSTQWFVLNRRHAEVVAHDTELMAVFGRHCSVGEDKELGRFRECISDQHYIPSLLAMYGLDNETSCDPSGGTYERWVHGRALGETATDQAGRAQGEAQVGHFQLYQPGHVSAELIASMRASVGGPVDVPLSDESELCSDWLTATQAALASLFDTSTITAETCPTTLGNTEFVQQQAADAYKDAALHPHCMLLGREFSRHAAKWVHRVYRSCTAALHVLACSERLTERDNTWWQ